MESAWETDGTRLLVHAELHWIFGREFADRVKFIAEMRYWRRVHAEMDAFCDGILDDMAAQAARRRIDEMLKGIESLLDAHR